jgi:hypothetical protein
VTGVAAGQPCLPISRSDVEIAGRKGRERNRVGAPGGRHAWWETITGYLARRVPRRVTAKAFRPGGKGAGDLGETVRLPPADVKNDLQTETLTPRGPGTTL